MSQENPKTNSTHERLGLIFHDFTLALSDDELVYSCCYGKGLPPEVEKDCVASIMRYRTAIRNRVLMGCLDRTEG